jgi:adenylate cyclase
MSLAGTSTAPQIGTDGGLGVAQLERSLRMWAGMILMLFVAMHLLNHAVGVFGVPAMEVVQHWRVALWRNWPGTILLYGALVVHVLLTLKRAVSRRTLRMPAVEAVQIILGLLIPIMLWRHIVDSRVMNSFAGVEDHYVNLLRYLYPEHAIWQTALVLIVWVHGCIGIRYMIRHRTWFARWRTTLYVAAFALPLLSLAGFVASGRESHTLTVPAENWNAAQIEVHSLGMLWGRGIAYAILVLPVVFLVVREIMSRLKASVMVRYVGHGDTHNPIGLTLLEMSRLNQIPHPSVCGGRGRCATCRVLLLSDTDTLPPPSSLERRLLDRIKAPQRVRLACQIKPDRDLNVKILLPIGVGRGKDTIEEEALKWGAERDVTVLFADIRGFSTLARTQLPQDLVVLLNRVIEDMMQAISAHGGRTAVVMTDGVMGVFGATGTLANSSTSAIRAAEDILKAAESANREIGGALPQPVRVGIGIHSGPAIVARLGDEEQGYSLSVIGETVVIASRLEEATKEFGADCVISEEALAKAGIKIPAGGASSLQYKNGDRPVAARAFADVKALGELV